MKALGSSTWSGNWRDGSGAMSTGGDTVVDAVFDFASRFQDGPGAVPEELLAAAWAGCLNQAFANCFSWGNFTAESIETRVTVELELHAGKGFPGTVHIDMTARVPGIEQVQFDALTYAAKNGCMLSRLANIEPTMTATLLP